MNMVFLLSHPEWVEAPEKKLHYVPSTAGKRAEVQLSTEVHSKSIHSVAVWKWKILEPMYKPLEVLNKLSWRYGEHEMWFSTVLELK